MTSNESYKNTLENMTAQLKETQATISNQAFTMACLMGRQRNSDGRSNRSTGTLMKEQATQSEMQFQH